MNFATIFIGQRVILECNINISRLLVKVICDKNKHKVKYVFYSRFQLFDENYNNICLSIDSFR